jgi:hypothetical protein
VVNEPPQSRDRARLQVNRRRQLGAGELELGGFGDHVDLDDSAILHCQQKDSSQLVGDETQQCRVTTDGLGDHDGVGRAPEPKQVPGNVLAARDDDSFPDVDRARRAGIESADEDGEVAVGARDERVRDLFVEPVSVLSGPSELASLDLLSGAAGQQPAAGRSPTVSAITSKGSKARP